jgi:parallel beta-helix repeat protein
MESRTLLSTFTVDHLADDMVGQGQSGSLRYCITNATDGDDIQFSVTGTINLTGALPDLTHSISIEGPGADLLTVRGSGASYPTFTVGSAATVVLSGLTISGNSLGIGNYAGTLTLTDCTVSGNYGGGIFNNQHGMLTLTDCTVSGNSAYMGGGIYNGGTATLTDCTVSGNSGGHGGLAFGNGGGIFNGGTLTLTDCTVSGNTDTVSGGGIGNYGTATLTDCTVSGNSVSDPYDRGGGVSSNRGTLTLTDCTVSGNSADSLGGGLYTGSASTATLTDCTVSGNSANSGGAISSFGTVTVSNSTITGNQGGGIVNFGTLTVSNSTLSGNSTNFYGGGIYMNSPYPVTLTNVTLTANRTTNLGGGLYVYQGTPVLHNMLIAGNFSGATGTTADDVYGSLDASGDYSLIGDGTGMSGLSNGVNGNQVGRASAPIDPKLGLLQDNGGPTQTMALLPGSPALNAGDPTQLGVPDQRGVVRSGGVNIGAFQASASAFLLNAPDTVQSGTPFDITVAAVDPFGQVAVGYTGTVTFSTSDTDPGVVLPADYSFTLNDGGVHTFSNTGLGEITLVTPGEQTLAVADTTDATINGNATITVMGGTVPSTHDRFWTDLAPSLVSADRRR